jgi:hypothetical protein
MREITGRIISILVIACLSLELFCQTTPRVNPFEVKGRKVSTQAISPITSDTILEANGQKPNDLTTSTIDTTLIDSTSAYISGNNPFDISHVPLPKKQVNINPIQELSKINVKVSDRFMDVLIFIPLALLAIVITVKANLLSYLTRSVFNINMMKLTKREEANNSLLLILLYIVFFINASIFIYLIQKHYTSQEGLKLWAYCLGGLLSIYLIRHFMMWLLGGVFPINSEVGFYNYVIIVFNILFGILIFPVNIVSIYLPEYTKIALIIGVSMFLIFYIIRGFRGISASLFSIGQGFLSFFIYLCTFEIAPLLIIIRGILNLKV